GRGVKIPQLVLQVEDDALSRLLPDAREAREKMEVFPPDGAHHLPHRSLGENGQSRLGPDPRHLQQQGKQIPLNSVGKTVQGPAVLPDDRMRVQADALDRKSTRLNSSHVKISYAVFCLKKKKHKTTPTLYD